MVSEIVCQRAIAEHVANPTRKVAAPQVAVERSHLISFKRRHELAQCACSPERHPPVCREDERTMLRHRDVDIFLTMTHMRGQAPPDGEEPRFPTSFFGNRQGDRLPELEMTKHLPPFRPLHILACGAAAAQRVDRKSTRLNS